MQHFYPQEPIAEFTEKISGKDVCNQPQLQQAIELCKKHKATLVVAKIGRLSRNTEQALRIYSELEGQLESCDIPNLDKFTLTLFMAIADREGELISLRTKAALTEKVKRGGEWRTASKPFQSGQASQMGVAAMKEKARTNENNRRAAALVKSLRENKREGKVATWREIADELNKGGFKTSKGSTFQPMQAMRLYNG